MVGVEIDGSRIFWGTCEDFSVDGLPSFESPYLVDEGIVSIERNIVPVIVGQKLSSFRQLASRIESLEETVTISKPASRPENQSRGFSRREIITGFLSSSEPDESLNQTEQITVNRSIHPAIRHGLSQALLSAVSMVRGVTVAEIIAEEFHLPIPTTTVALQMPIKGGQSLFMHDQVSALAYAIGKANPEDSIGPNGERIQGFIRQFRERLLEADQHNHLTIHLDAGGNLGKLFDNDLGKVLGALYGLEQAASPYLIRVQDPLIMDDLDSQIKVFGQLRDYLRMRQMSLQLVASARINTANDVRAFAQAQSAHMLRLVTPQLGTIQEMIVAIQTCQAHDIGILMEGTLSANTGQVALVTQPDLLTFSTDQLGEAGVAFFHNEMACTLAWLAKKYEANNRDSSDIC